MTKINEAYELIDSDKRQRILLEEVAAFEKYGGEATQNNLILAEFLREEIMFDEALLQNLRSGRLSVTELKDPLNDSTIQVVKK